MNFFRKNLPLNQRSQIAVIITFVIAVIFLFIAVFINLSKVSQVKTATSTAVDRTALSLASQLGSMSRYYKEKVVPGGIEKTATDEKKVIEACGFSEWVPLATLILTGIVTGIFAVVFWPAAVVGAGVGAFSTVVLSSTVLGGINTKFKEMSGYNGMRENALFQSLSATQSDDVELKAKTPGSGVFFEDVNGNGVFDEDSEEEKKRVYDLRAIPEMRNERKVSRFAAWYYAKRLPLVSDESMKDSLAVFINGINGIKGFIDADERDSSGNIIELSYWITPKSGDRNYKVTCSGSSCPSWVKDANTGQLRIVRMDSSNAAYGGFLDPSNSPPLHTLKNLFTRLNSSYSGTFPTADVDNLIEDLRIFLLKSKEVLNMPVSQRLSGLSLWSSSFYDPAKHKPGSREPIDPDDPKKYTYDIYLRLMRDQNYVNQWIAELETLNNNTIALDIRKKHGDCTWGRGSQLDRTCNTVYGQNCSICGGGYCGESESSCNSACMPYCCYNPQKCAWEGIYYTCCQSPPVCSSGDLYGAKPGWCSSHGYHALCSPSCASCTENFNCADEAKFFQGQLSWRPSCSDPTSCIYLDGTDKPTEVEQAFRILRALNEDLARIQMTIAALADAIAKQLPSWPYEPHNDTNNNGIIEPGEFTDLNGNGRYDDYLPEFFKRIEIVYAWKDKPVQGKTQYSHLARVKIDGYPDNLPNVTESPALLGLQTCRTLNNYQGDFKITVSRYDQDQPTDIAGWNLRRRLKPSNAEFDTAKLAGMVNDIQNTGELNPASCCDCHVGSYCQSNIDNLLDNYAITSCSQAHYGPGKSDIYITGTQCD